MSDSAEQLRLLMELDARHDELLDRLDDLDRRVSKVLGEWTSTREPGFAAVPPHAEGGLPPSVTQRAVRRRKAG